MPGLQAPPCSRDITWCRAGHPHPPRTLSLRGGGHPRSEVLFERPLRGTEARNAVGRPTLQAAIAAETGARRRAGLDARAFVVDE